MKNFELTRLWKVSPCFSQINSEQSFYCAVTNKRKLTQKLIKKCSSGQLFPPESCDHQTTHNNSSPAHCEPLLLTSHVCSAFIDLNTIQIKFLHFTIHSYIMHNNNVRNGVSYCWCAVDFKPASSFHFFFEFHFQINFLLLIYLDFFFFIWKKNTISF